MTEPTKKTILVMDTSVVFSTLARFLGDEYNLIMLDSAKKALQKVDEPETSIDLILVSGSAGMSARQVISELEQRRKPYKVILTSAFEDITSDLIVDYCPKPWAKPDLVTRVKRYI